jgi:hypothetical protein
MATIDPFLQDAAFDPGALQAMSTAPLVGAFSWNVPGRLRVIRPNQQRVNGTGMNAGSSSERPSGYAPGWPFRCQEHPPVWARWIRGPHNQTDCARRGYGAPPYGRWRSFRGGAPVCRLLSLCRASLARITKGASTGRTPR